MAGFSLVLILGATMSFANSGNQQSPTQPSTQQYRGNATERAENFQERKQKMLQTINQRIQRLTEAKACVEAAQPGQLKNCVEGERFRNRQTRE